MREAVILSAVRVPTGRFLGSLKGLTAPQLGALVVKEAVRRADVPGDQVDEVIMGNVVSAGLRPGARTPGRDPRRPAAEGGRPDDQQGLRLGPQGGDAGRAGHRHGRRRYRGRGRDGVDVELPVPADRRARGAAAGPRRAARLDDLGRPVGCVRRLPHGLHGRDRGGEVRGHAPAAGRSSRWTAIARRSPPSRPGSSRTRSCPCRSPRRRAIPSCSRHDESPREDTVAGGAGEARSRRSRTGGTVTAGNAPGVNDGGRRAGRDVGRVARRRWAASRWPASSDRPSAGLEPSMVMMTPVHAVRKLWAKTGWSAGMVDLFELNEAFAVQARGGHRASWSSIPAQGQRQRRRGGAGPSDRRQRRAHPDHAALCAARPREAARRRHASAWAAATASRSRWNSSSAVRGRSGRAMNAAACDPVPARVPRWARAEAAPIASRAAGLARSRCRRPSRLRPPLLARRADASRT